MSAGVVVPIRAFEGGKLRLAPRLDASTRARLFETMADGVVAAARHWPVVVVTSAPEVRSWAGQWGLEVVDDPGTLDGAATAGRDLLSARGFSRVFVVHADLPLVTDLSPLAAPGDDPVVVAAPCHRDDGTPVLSVPATAPFRFAYGPGSFARHVAEARRLGLEVTELRDDMTLRRDLDSVEDLEALAIELP